MGVTIAAFCRGIITEKELQTEFVNRKASLVLASSAGGEKWQAVYRLLHS